MRILYASPIETNRGWGADTFINAAFAKIGVETALVDYRQNRDRLSTAFERHSSARFDGFLLQRGERFPLYLAAAMPKPRVFIASELVARRRDQDDKLCSKTIDYTFVRSNACREEVLARGWRTPEEVSVLLSAFDPALFFRELQSSQKDIDVLFVGSPMARRDAILDELANHVSLTRTKAFGADMRRLYNRAKVVLNLHSTEYLDTETRVFEVLGCGAFLLTETLASESPFRSGEHLVEADGVEELIEKARYYVARDDEREAIAQAGLDFVSREHTYEARARQIVEVIERLRDLEEEQHTIDPRLLKRYKATEPVRRFGRRVRRFGSVIRSAVSGRQ